jgi:hypothetical protein
MFDPVLAEQAFQLWFQDLAKRLGINPDADTHPYDYRAAWRYLQSTGRPLSGPELKLFDVFGSAGEGVPTFTPPFEGFKTLAPSPLAGEIAQMSLPAPAQGTRSFTPVAPVPTSAPMSLENLSDRELMSIANGQKPQATRPTLKLPATPSAAPLAGGSVQEK